jgi:hypothetical protein
LLYAELWGSREAKLAALANASWNRIESSPPEFRMTPSPGCVRHTEYDGAWSLADAMPVNATAPVTARDHFVVAFTAEELRERVAAFCDLTTPDDEIRRRYFQRTRSARYETGDTRGWKLAAARRALAADADWPQKIVRCLYRPFDWRYVFWHPAMIDWPRGEVTRHLVSGLGTEGSGTQRVPGVRGSGRQESGVGDRELSAAGRDAAVLGTQYSVPGTACRSARDLQALVPNPKSQIPNSKSQLCLIARRQQPPSQPCTYFWIADGLALDGVIRSDNRGSESLFPLYVRDDQGCGANFADEFVALAERSTRLTWLPLGCGDLAGTFGPEDLLAFVYAQFHAPSYRERYSAALRSGFPRVLLPASAEQFGRLSRAGKQLIDLHLLRSGCAGPANGPPPAEAAAFRAGGYVALRKWLQPVFRSSADPQYSRIAAAIARTIELMRQIDAEFAIAGPQSSSAGSLASLS